MRIKTKRPALDKIDHAIEILLAADRHLRRDSVGSQLRPDGLEYSEEIRANPVKLVYKNEPRNIVGVRLPPDSLRLSLDASCTAENSNRSIQDTKRTLDLGSKIHMPGSIYNVDLEIIPIDGCRRGCNRDPPALLFRHPVHGCRTRMDLSHPMLFVRIIEHSFRNRRLARIDVGDDSYVADRALGHERLPAGKKKG